MPLVRARAQEDAADTAGVPRPVSDLAAIESVIWTYLDGLHEGDTEKLAAAFHPCSHLYGEDQGGVLDWPRDHWLDVVRKRASAKSQGHSRHDRIVSIDQSGPGTAFAKVECALPPRFFVDYLTLINTQEGWRIVAKAFKAETR
jgi:Putative lumazine-binding